MKGKIKKYDPDMAAGIIRGSDENFYKFVEHDWWDSKDPKNDQDVDFIPENDRALAIMIDQVLHQGQLSDDSALYSVADNKMNPSRTGF